MNSNNQNASGRNLSSLVDRLKSEDSRYATLSRVIQVVYWIFIPLYMFLGIRHYLGSGEVSQLIGSACMVVAFLIFALFFGKYYKEYKYVDYSLPTLTMLKKAVYRYQPFQGRMIWGAAAIVLMNVGLTMRQNDVELRIGIQLVFWSTVILALMVGLFIWFIKYKPLRDDALRLIAEIEGD